MFFRRLGAAVVVIAIVMSPLASNAAPPTPQPSPSETNAAGTEAPTGTAGTEPSGEADDTGETTAEDVDPAAITRLIQTALSYEEALTAAEDARKEAGRLRTSLRKTMRRAEAYVSQVIDYAVSPSADPFSQKLHSLAAAENPEDLINSMYSHEQISQAHGVRLRQAKKAFDKASTLRKETKAATKQAEEAGQRSDELLEQLTSLTSELGFGESSPPAGLPATRAEQKQWNAEAKADWKRTRQAARHDRVGAPAAKRLRKLKKLPGNMKPLRIDGKRATAGGVARVKRGRTWHVVLPKETIALVDGLLARIDQPHSAKPAKGSYTCGDVAAVPGAYKLTGTPAQIYSQTRQIPWAERQTGDLLFFADKDSGIHHLGVYLGDDLMIDSPASRHTVGVSKIPQQPFAVTRPALGKAKNTPPPVASGGPTSVCGATLPKDQDTGGWSFPMKRGTYRMSASFGQRSGLWRTVHTGQDLAAPMGTPIYASRAGTVSLEEIGWAGTLITVSRPDGTAERYAHTSAQLVASGEKVKAGQKIALVGSRGNSTGPHLHFEIMKKGEFVDPMPLLVQRLTVEVATKSWGGYGNGQVPLSVLCPVGEDLVLRCDVARDVRSLSKAFKKKFDQDLPITGAYLSIADQIKVDDQGRLVDIPGTSDLGWGTEFTIGEIGAKQAAWLDKNAPGYSLKKASAGRFASSR